MTSKEKLIEFLKSANLTFEEKHNATKNSCCIKTRVLWYFFDYNGNYMRSL